MARTKAEVRAYLESVLGQSVDANCGEYQGQCVSLIKGLMNFLGVPDPYRPRGNAKDAGDIYLNQGIADNGDGWLRVCVNRDMGVVEGIRYGHIWIDLKDEVNYEQNGKTALRVTKNTRPITQAQQIVNLDKWITDQGGGSSMIVDQNNLKYLYMGIYGQDPSVEVSPTDPEIGKDYAETTERLLDYANRNGIAFWQFKPATNQTITDLTKKTTDQTTEIANLQDDNAKLSDENKELKKQVNELEAQLAAGGGDVTINFNFVGVFLWSIIKAFGYNKKG